MKRWMMPVGMAKNHSSSSSGREREREREMQKKKKFGGGGRSRRASLVLWASQRCQVLWINPAGSSVVGAIGRAEGAEGASCLPGRTLGLYGQF